MGLEKTESGCTVGLLLVLNTAHAVLLEMRNSASSFGPVVCGSQGIAKNPDRIWVDLVALGSSVRSRPDSRLYLLVFSELLCVIEEPERDGKQADKLACLCDSGSAGCFNRPRGWCRIGLHDNQNALGPRALEMCPHGRKLPQMFVVEKGQLEPSEQRIYFWRLDQGRSYPQSVES